MEFFIPFVPPCRRMPCFVSGLLVRGGGSARDDFITKVLDQEGIKKAADEIVYLWFPGTNTWVLS